MRLGLLLFGAFQMTWDDEAITLSAGAARGLLAYLALEADRPHRRELVAALLWPDLPQTAAYANLRQTLARVRKVLPNTSDALAFLEITPQTLQLKSATVAIDVARFEELLAACAAHSHPDLVDCSTCAERLTEAVALYRGELLHGLFLPQPFEEWLLLKREQFQRQALGALNTLAEHHLRAGRFAAAADAARRQLALNPWHEAAHRQLMRALAEGGDRAAALAAFEHCHQVLQNELGIEPDAETLALAAQIRTAEATAQSTRPTLPTPITALIGREEELAQLGRLLQSGDARLVTIVGVGGVGKTRLALAGASALGDVFADGIGWVPLAGITAAALPLQHDALATAVRVAIGQSFGGQGTPLDDLCDYLRERTMLLVLDNCEHLPGVAPFVRQLLEAAPRLRVLATSRVMLDIVGEMPLRLDGLPVPERGADDPASYAGMRLFLERARQQVRDFDESEANLKAVAQLCRLLDGLPLGIELATRWVRHYTCDEIVAEIQADLDFLTVQSGDVPERQRGLRAAFDYSWRLLAPAERLALARLSMFRGVFDRAAAQAVATTRVTTLATLVDASLLRHVGVGRYGFHELVRQFAAARLAESGEMETLAERHAAYYLELMAQQEAALYGAAPQMGATAIRNTADNMRQSWDWAVTHGAWDRVAQALPALRRYALLDGLFYEYASRVAAAIDQLNIQQTSDEVAPKQGALLSRLLSTKAFFLERQEARSAAAAVAREAIARAAAAHDAIGEAYAYLQLSTATVPYIAALAPREMLPAISWLEQAIVLCRTGQDSTPREYRYATEVEAECLLKLSTIRIELREYAAACALAEQALSLVQQSGDRMQEARALSFSAMALENAGRYEAAYERRIAMLSLARANGSRHQEQLALNNLSCTLIYLGDYRSALEHARASLRISGEWMQNPYENADDYHTFSWAACRAGETEIALEVARQALVFAQDTGIPQNQTLPLLALGDALHDLYRYDEAYAAYAAALALGREREMPPLIAVALAGIARCRLAQGALAEAQEAVNEMLRGPDILTLGSLWEPLRIAETCYRVLQANDDPRATELLRAAAALLNQLASQITDHARRRVFREDVAAHRAILEALLPHPLFFQ